jgi:flagella basal body P-ring formation protein FlgA
MTMPRNSGSFILAILLGTLIPAAGQSQQNRIAITPQHVVSAMAGAGWKVSVGQVQLLSQVTSTVRDAWLEVLQVTHWQEDKLKVELRCHDPRVCLPFYVVINQGGTAVKFGQTMAADTEVDAKHSVLEMPAEKPLMRSGDPATLTFADKGLRITMPVVCLENGQRGQRIRVASADHKRFYKAEIVGPGLLRATAL